MANVSEQMDSKTTPMARNMSEKIQNFGNAAEKVSHNIGNRLGSAVGDMSERATEYVSTTREYVKGHPLQSLAIAAATGAAIGSLFAMVSRSRSKQ